MTTESRFLRGGAVLAALALAAMTLPGADARAADGAEWFNGKTVTYIVATAAGGGYDGYGRLTARHMEKHLPGATFVVVNRPGAGHLIGTNLIYAARPDGTTLGSFNMGVMYSQLVGAGAARFDLARMSWIGKAATDTRIIMVGKDAPFKNFLDLRTAKEPVPFAVSGVGSAAYTELQLLAKVFDLNIKMLSGYSGNDDEMAIMRGEVVGKMGAVSGQGDFVRAGRGRFILAVGDKRDPFFGNASIGSEIAETPEQKAVIKLIASQGEMMRVTAGPPDIKSDRLSALRDAYRNAFSDSELLADARRLHYVIEPGVGEEVADLVKAALDQPPRIRAMLEELQKAKPKTFAVSASLTEVRRGGREIQFKDGDGKDSKAKISGSRTKIEIAGKADKRGNLKTGMSCEVTYRGPGTEATLVACK